MTATEKRHATKFPLLVQFEFHPESEVATTVDERLHKMLNADSAVPGRLQIPTYFTPDDGSGEPPKPVVSAEADRVLVVLLADDRLAATALNSTKSGMTWGEYAVKLRSMTEVDGHYFMPVQLTDGAHPIDKRLEGMTFLPAHKIDDGEERCKFIARHVVNLLIRRLRPHTKNGDALPVNIFLSHTKLDIDKEPRVVEALLNHMRANHPEKPWFDSGDIPAGSRFEHEIKEGVKDAALLAVVTDSYSSRTWCRREILLAKECQRPAVIVDAVQEREIRRFPYSGNIPVMRWRGKDTDAWDAVDLLLRETLRHAYAEASLAQRKHEGDLTLPAAPELLTIARCKKGQTVLYPDPPLGPEELKILEETGVCVETPLQRHALKYDLRKCNLTVALSVSHAEDIGRYGLRQAHLDSILLELSRYLLLAGIRLSYGGDLRLGGYTRQLANLLRDPIVSQLRGNQTGDHSTCEFVNYLPWQTPKSVRDTTPLGEFAKTIPCDRPKDINESLDSKFVERPEVKIPDDTDIRCFALSRGLTTMRERQTEEMDARILVGGKIGRPDNSYQGRMPGILEEALLGMRKQRPIYLVGAFGGCARLVLDAFDGAPRTGLTEAHHQSLPGKNELKKTYNDQGAQWDEFESIASELKERGFAGLNNGLTEDENRELATTRSAERIVELVFQGLQKRQPPISASGAE